MWTLIRHVAAIVALPLMAVVVIPSWLAHHYSVTFHAPITSYDAARQFIGLSLLVAGLALFIASLVHFARYGGGTLAPWDPPRQLVVGGPYRFVRPATGAPIWRGLPEVSEACPPLRTARAAV